MHVYRQIGSVLALLAACGSVRAGDLTVYSALESEEIAIYLAAAKKALPDIDVHVLRLRKALRDAEHLIKTVRSVGYMLSAK